MIADLLTIVVPTRDRPALLELCLRSIFEAQTHRIRVIISDNSTKEWPPLSELRQKYGFDYLRQSGDLTITDHHNHCLHLPRTNWMMLLHDDDELHPRALEALEPLLAGDHDVALFVGGIDYVDAAGNTLDQWMPAGAETVTGDEAVLRLGMDFHARSPNIILNVAHIRESGGYAPENLAAADYELYGRLAFAHGVSFVPVRLGRYRLGHEQVTNVATPEQTERHLRQSVGAAESLRSVGCRTETLQRVVDQMTWGLFLSHAGRWRDSNLSFVCRLFDICRRASPSPGPMRARAKREYPLLFWRPTMLARLIYRTAERLGYRVTRPDRNQSRNAASIWKDYSTPKPPGSGTSLPT